MQLWGIDYAQGSRRPDASRLVWQRGIGGDARTGSFGAHCRRGYTGAGGRAKAARRSRNIKARRVAVADKRQEGPRGPGTVEEALRSCLALWDPGTHMSKQEWARACKRVAERLRGTG
jgi:hypothetical protein